MAHSGLQPRSVCCHSLDPDNWSTTCQLSFSKQSPLKALLFVFQMLAIPAPAHVPCPAFFSLSVATLGLWILPGPWPTWLPQLHLLLRLAGCSLASSPSSVIKTSRQGWGPSPATASLPQNRILVCHDVWLSSFLPAANQKHSEHFVACLAWCSVELAQPSWPSQLLTLLVFAHPAHCPPSQSHTGMGEFTVSPTF